MKSASRSSSFEFRPSAPPMPPKTTKLRAARERKLARRRNENLPPNNSLSPSAAANIQTSIFLPNFSNSSSTLPNMRVKSSSFYTGESCGAEFDHKSSSSSEPVSAVVLGDCSSPSDEPDEYAQLGSGSVRGEKAEVGGLGDGGVEIDEDGCMEVRRELGGARKAGRRAEAKRQQQQYSKRHRSATAVISSISLQEKNLQLVASLLATRLSSSITNNAFFAPRRRLLFSSPNPRPRSPLRQRPLPQTRCLRQPQSRPSQQRLLQLQLQLQLTILLP